MAKIQIITSHEADCTAACEALWIDLAMAALKEGHQIEVLVPEGARINSEIRELLTAGATIRFRSSRPQNGGFKTMAYKIWLRTGARFILPMRMRSPADIRILNVGTMIEVADEPWGTLIEASKSRIATIIHNNPEIREYSEKIENKIKILLNRSLQNYFVSHRLVDNAEQQLLMRISNATTVRNPVNLTNRLIEPWPSDSGQLRFAAVGRLNSFVKGQIRLLNALSSERWKSRAWTLNFFGDGPDRARIERAVEFYGLSDRVCLKGHVKDVRSDIWRNHHVLVMPSMLEGMPMTLIEAMLCGRPAVCSDVGGASELIRDGENGFLADSPFCSQLNRALERMWDAREELSQMGKAAHDDASEFLPADPGRKLLQDLLRIIETC